EASLLTAACRGAAADRRAAGRNAKAPVARTEAAPRYHLVSATRVPPASGRASGAALERGNGRIPCGPTRSRLQAAGSGATFGRCDAREASQPVGLPLWGADPVPGVAAYSSPSSPVKSTVSFTLPTT